MSAVRIETSTDTHLSLNRSCPPDLSNEYLYQMGLVHILYPSDGLRLMRLYCHNFDQAESYSQEALI